jgi:hypothetical protein
VADETVREVARKAIHLPEGSTHVRFDEVAGLIATALHGKESAVDDAALRRQVAVDQVRLTLAGRNRRLARPLLITDRELAMMHLVDELETAVQEGQLILRNPLTLGIHTMPTGHALESALVTVADLSKFAADRDIEVVIEKSCATKSAAPGLDADSAVEHKQRGQCAPWIPMAQDRARAIIAEQRKRDLYPPQIRIAEQIAREFRKAVPQVVGAGGKPLTGEYIKRHALRGISSAQGKARSTAKRQGK